MKMLALLFCVTICSDQVFADAIDGRQALDCDTTIQNDHHLLLHDLANLTTIRAAIRNINESLHDLSQRENTLKAEAEKARGLKTLLQRILSKIEENGTNECGVSAKKQQIENEIMNLKSRLTEMDFTLNVLKTHMESTSLQLKQMEAQEKEIEISILHQVQQSTRGPFVNIETFLVSELEGLKKTLEFERFCCQQRLEASSKLDAKLKLVESAENYSIQDIINEIVNLQTKQNEDRVANIEQQLENAKTSNRQCLAKGAENINEIKNFEDYLNTCEQQNTHISLESMQIREQLKGKYPRYRDEFCKNITTKARLPASQCVTLSTGTYYFNMQGLNWAAARAHCQSLGMDLVAIETEFENELVAKYAIRLNLGWTSGCYSQKENAVVWRSTGHKASYANWSPRHNHGCSRGCVALNQRRLTTTWEERPINDERPSICEKM